MAVALSGVQEQRLLETAREGDERAFREIVEIHRAELHAHCYRMLGSVHDADDALQDTLLRAWRGLPGFDGRSALRSWLYTVATNVCRDAIARRPKRVLPIEYGPSTVPGQDPGDPVVESVWIEAYPDEGLGLPPAPLALTLGTSSARRWSSRSSPRSSTCPELSGRS